eukprot:3973622-Prymnesium_polylepis.1
MERTRGSVYRILVALPRDRTLLMTFRGGPSSFVIYYVHVCSEVISVAPNRSAHSQGVCGASDWSDSSRRSSAFSRQDR